jgi:hypothetical protein
VSPADDNAKTGGCTNASLVSCRAGFRFAEPDERGLLCGMDEAEKVFAEAREAGIDLNLIDCNLALSYEDRVLRHESALALVRALKEARIAHEKSTPVAATAR